MLLVDNVSSGYEGIDVIKNISFELNENSNLAILGQNGCGKTTLLRNIAKVLPFKGNIYLDGIPYSKMERKDISLKIAMLSSQTDIYFSYTVYETVMMGRYVHLKDKFFSRPKDEDIKKVMETLEAVDLLSEKDREISKLSSGQLQRVFLARTLAQEPRLILLDEPTSHLDLKCQVEIVDYLKKWSSGGDRAVIGVFHDINLAMDLCDKILVIKNGELKALADKNDIIESCLLNSVFEMDVAQYMKSSLSLWNS